MDIIYTNVQLTEEQAKQFVIFQQRYLQLNKLIQQGVFDLRNARVTLDIDASGNIGEIDITKRFRY